MPFQFSFPVLFPTRAFSLLCVAGTLTGCLGEREPANYNTCGDLGPAGFYDINGLQGEVFVTTTDVIDGGSTQRTMASEYVDSVEYYDALAIKLKFSAEQYYAKVPRIPFISQAHACSPAYPEFTENIVAMSVTSSQAYSSEIAAGESLNELVDVVEIDHFASAWDTYFPRPVAVADALGSYPYNDIYGVVILELGSAPELSGEYIFFIEITLDSGETYTYETPEISLIGSEQNL